ncbi:dethiobiotin synthase [bacterium E08(2017)]|nr:dethiobiotin synthase [bacterium E08(2017)]
MITFVTGIDTNIGKTYTVASLALDAMSAGKSVITQKLVQTGSDRPAEDIVKHRELMGIDLNEDDLSGLTCPYVFPKPASPHLAAKLAGERIDAVKITKATDQLAAKYDEVIIEGAGGLMVSLDYSFTVLDYIELHCYPTVLVTSPRLGSINHTLMSIELILSRNIPLKTLVYNCFEQTDPEITADSRKVFEEYLAEYSPATELTDLQPC